MEGNNPLLLQEEIQCDIDIPEHIEHGQSRKNIRREKILETGEM